MEPSFVLIHIGAVVRALQGTIQHHLYGLPCPSSGHLAGDGGVRDLSQGMYHNRRIGYSLHKLPSAFTGLLEMIVWVLTTFHTQYT